MADRFPLIIDNSAEKIKELVSGDNLDLTKSNLKNADHIQSAGVNVAGVATATSLIGDGSQLTNLPPSGGSLTATASGTLADGDTTIVNADGTVSAVTGSQIGWIATVGDTDNRAGLDYFQDAAVDSSGNVYTVGYTTTEGQGNREALVIKYNSSGVQQWQRLLGDSNPNYAYGVVLDSSGDVYVSGVGDSQKGIIFKYNSSGSLQWQKEVPNMVSGFIAMDSSGNIYVAGTFYTGGSNRNWLIMKLNNSGSLTWAREMTGSGNEFVTGIALDSSGDVYISGHADTSSAGSYDMAIAKYNTSGTFQWHYYYGASGWETTTGIAVDSSSNAYTLSYSSAPGSNDTSNGNLIITKWNSSGTIVWQRTLGDPSTYEELANYSNSVAVDSSDNVYILAMVNGSATFSGTYDIIVAKYNSSGVIQWQRFFGGADTEEPAGISVDNSGYIYITGYTKSTTADPASRQDGFIAKLPDDGTGVGTHGDFTYVASNLIDAAGGISRSSGGLTDSSSSVSVNNASMTSAAGTVSGNTLSIESTNMTAENFIGISNGAYTNGQTATIQIIGAVDDAQVGLTTGKSYYIQKDGSLSTTAGSPSVFAGTSIAATKLIVRG